MRILASIVLTAALAACSTPAPSGPITQGQAEAAARTAFPEATDLKHAALGPIAGFGANVMVVPGDRVVWAMTFAGSFARSCGPAPPPGATAGPCPPPATSATVFIDAGTGAFITGMTPAIQPR